MSNSSIHVEEPSLRVLLVPDLIHWITGRIARQIAEYNPWIEPTICSGPLLHKLLQNHGGKFPGEIDVAHFLTPYVATDFIDVFRDKVPCVTTIHHVEDERSIEAEPRADAVMTVCRQWHDHLISIGVDPGKLVMVRNGVEPGVFRPPSADERKNLRRQWGIDEEAFVVGFSAKRSSDSRNRKGVETLASAMVELRRRLPHAVLVIIGPGWGDLVAQQVKQGVHCLHLPFIMAHEDVAAIYRMLDVYWVTARMEGGPVPLLEAMSSEVACITTPVGVALEAVRHDENGIVVAFGDVDAIVHHTEMLAANPEMRRKIGRAARQTILDDYTCADTSKSAHQLYKTAMGAFQRRRMDAVIRSIRSHPDPHETKAPPGNTLCGIPRSLWPWAESQEKLILMQSLLQMGANKAAYQLGRQALWQRPLDLGLWRSMLALSPAAPAFRAARKGYRQVKRLATQPGPSS